MQLIPPFQIGAWRIDPDVYRITGPTGTAYVEPKAMAVLCRLADEAEEVVTREELLACVWPDTIVVEETLTRCISELRKVFRDDARIPSVIETIRGRGYRLMLPATPPPARHEQESVAAPPTPGRPVWLAGRERIGRTLAATLVILGGLTMWGLNRPEGERTTAPTLARPVTTAPGIEYGAQLSPDGDEVVYISIELGGDADLYVKRLGANASVRLTDDPANDVAPAWSPDGQQVAFMRFDAEGACLVLIVPRAGGAAHPAGSCASNTFQDLAWSPDGRWLAFSAAPGDGASDGIVLIDRVSDERHVLTVPPSDTWGDNTPVFDPDSRRVAFARRLGEEAHDLYVVDLAEPGREVRVTTGSHVLVGHDWTPDGQQLVFSSNRSGRFGLWAVAVPEHSRMAAVAALPGAEPRWIETGLADARQPSMATAGRRLLFAQDQRDTNLWAVSFEASSSAQPVVESTHRDERGHISPDGQRIAFVSERSGHPEIWVADRNGQRAEQLTRFESTAVDAPRWSPDGRRLAFSARPDGHIDVFVLDVESGLLRQLTTAPSDEGLPRWSRDGEHLYFASNRTGRWEVWGLPVEGGEPAQMTTGGGLVAEERADGQGLLFTRPDEAGLWWLPAPGAVPQQVSEYPGEADWGNWAAGSSGAYILRRAEGQVFLEHVTVEEGTARTVATLAEHSAWAVPWSQSSLALWPDESGVLVTRTERHNSDLWLMEWPEESR